MKKYVFPTITGPLRILLNENINIEGVDNVDLNLKLR